MGLKEYEFTTADGRTETLLLDAEDAKRVKAANEVTLATEKARRAGASTSTDTKGRKPADKAATPENK